MSALRRRWRLACWGAAALLLAGCVAAPPLVTAVPASPASPVSSNTPPPAPREFRAAWVATVANIDWPSRAGLDSAQQQAEMRAILDAAQRLQLNAIVLQVRPAADAIYPSALEPWSEVLSGTQGKAPSPAYDPLQTWIAEAHRRGLQLHAWVNPYRARSNSRSVLAPTHIANTHPELVRSYGEQLWMDPAEPQAAQRTLDVVADIARRYDVDGIHIDDYFYPYPIADAQNPGGELDFPDGPAWQRYVAAGGPLPRTDWRRQQVNQLVQRMHALVHRDKPWLRFGISPFGIGKPERRASGIQGFSQYDKLYADVELWLEQGWLDYLAPQLYWPVDQSAQAFGVLLQTWQRDNPQQRPIWPGLFTSRIDGSAKSWSADEIRRQIALTRQAATQGHLHFSMVALLQNRDGVADVLRTHSYPQAALVPAAPWLGDEALAEPQVLRWERSEQGLQVLLEPDDGKGQMLAVWARYGGQWRFFTQPVQSKLLNLRAQPGLGLPDRVVISRTGRYGQESARTTLDF